MMRRMMRMMMRRKRSRGRRRTEVCDSDLKCLILTAALRSRPITKKVLNTAVKHHGICS